MEFIRDKSFDDYVEKYKKLPLSEKKEIVNNDIKELLVVLEQLNIKNGGTSKMLFNKEILDLKKENTSEEDFVEAMFVYIFIIKELIANYLESQEK